MTDVTGPSPDFAPFDRDDLSRRVSTHAVACAIALACLGLVGARMLDERLMQPVPKRAEAPARATVAAIAVPPRGYGALLDPAPSTGSTPAFLAQSSPLPADFTWAPAATPVVVAAADPSDLPAPALPEPSPDAAPVLPLQAPDVSPLVASVPLPIPRPADLQEQQRESRAPFRTAIRRMRPVRPMVAAAPPDNRSFFEKLFGMPKQPSGPALAYAAPEDNAFTNAQRSFFTPAPSSDRLTAVYDISAHTVYMPDGSRLEAHSGLGALLDDPNRVNERNRGATPPHVYDLEPRAQLFHGVRALRLNPVGGGSVFGRTGLLAHTFMLGPNGDSNGCVSFRNYNAFLQAYANGSVRRLAVVARRT